MTKPLGPEVALAQPFDQAVARVRAALKAEGFGILTEIDLRQAFREKLGREFRPFVILGACNPPLAYAAIDADPQVGLLLPCNVTVEATGPGTSLVRLTDPEVLLGASAAAGTPALGEIARDAGTRLARVAAELRQAP
ncbi:MAG: DUF302 domain-containing protein [Deltaproteobacteria bacterium]